MMMPGEFSTKNQDKEELIAAIILDLRVMHLALVAPGGDILIRRSVNFSDDMLPESLVPVIRLNINIMLTEINHKKRIKGYGFAISRSYVGHRQGNDQSITWQFIVSAFSRAAVDVLRCRCYFVLKCNAAALAEYHFGGRKLSGDFITISISEELSGSIVSNGKITPGYSGLAGALGNFIVRPRSSEMIAARSPSSLSSLCGYGGIIKTAEEIKLCCVQSALHQVPSGQLDARKIFELADRGDAAANRVVSYTGQILGEALAVFATFSSPASIIVRSDPMIGISRFIDTIKRSMETNLLPIYQNKINLSFSHIRDEDAYFLGCSALFR